METIRGLLNCLSRDALMHLTYQRGLGTSASNGDRRSKLARSYRGDVAMFLEDLRREDLLLIVKDDLLIDDKEYYLPNAARYAKEQLVHFAQSIFIRGAIPGEFVELEEDGDEGDDGLEDDPNDTEDDDGAADDERDSHRRREGEQREDPFPEVGAELSKPRIMRRVLAVLGMAVPQRLRQERFTRVVEELEALGLEVFDVAGARFRPSDESPGIQAKIRLRRAAKDAPSASGPRHRSGTRGPEIVVAPGGGPGERKIPRPSDYEIAVRRLELLTALPCVDRARHPGWPHEFLDAATGSLTLNAGDLQIVRSIAASHVVGGRSEFQAAAQLVHVLDPKEWEDLLAHFRRLNNHAPEQVAVLLDHVRRVTGAGPERRPESPAADLEDRPPSHPRAMPMAAAGPKESERLAAANTRDLGALKGMFDD